jgi:hypothetical protein
MSPSIVWKSELQRYFWWLREDTRKERGRERERGGEREEIGFDRMPVG